MASVERLRKIHYTLVFPKKILLVSAFFLSLRLLVAELACVESRLHNIWFKMTIGKMTHLGESRPVL